MAADQLGADPPSDQALSTTSPNPAPSRKYEIFVPEPIPPATPQPMIREPTGKPGEDVAEGPLRPMTFLEVLRSLPLAEIRNVHRKPCARDAFLTGISGGFLVGGVRAILGAPIPKAANWAAGTMVIASVVSHEYCQYRRRLEIERMKYAVELMERKKLERERIKAAEEAESRAREAELAEAQRKQQRWWSGW
ncbi:MAG: hypothetical protein M1826_006349 [Phylliscum demangeonii]|nr:MAG: hypothetical protein M1826_006349 [Phylliscum demangeonii]